MLWKPTSTRIVTRCRGGNTWSIPRWRSVFISLFTNVALSRCVHYKKSTAGWITPSCRMGLQWGTCAEARLCYLNSWHSLVRHVQVCTDLRLLYHIEGGEKMGLHHRIQRVLCVSSFETDELTCWHEMCQESVQTGQKKKNSLKTHSCQWQPFSSQLYQCYKYLYSLTCMSCKGVAWLRKVSVKSTYIIIWALALEWVKLVFSSFVLLAQIY